VQLYLYSSQDLIVHNSSHTIKAGSVCQIQFCDKENVLLYPTCASGVMMINEDILINQQHSQIQFHKLSECAILCEVKPFVLNDNARQFKINGGYVKVIENANTAYIYFNGCYHGSINQKFNNLKFDKLEKNGTEYGIVYFDGDQKYIIVFDKQRVIYCGQYIDSEVTKNYIQIYCHAPNIFNIGNLVKHDLVTNITQHKAVNDRGDELKQNNQNFNIIYFLEAIKCHRFKYAHNKLSYELKSMIDIETLGNYFKAFDKYIYVEQQDAYITLKNNKVIGIYHFVVKDNLIDNIY